MAVVDETFWNRRPSVEAVTFIHTQGGTVNPLEILKRLQTPQDWGTFVLGLLVGVTVTMTTLTGLEKFLNLELVTKDSYLRKEQIDQAYVSNESVARLYVSRQDIIADYVPRSEVERSYLLRSEVLENYMPKSGNITATAPAVDPAKFIARTDLADKYMLKTEISRLYVPKNACVEETLKLRPINKTWTMHPGDSVHLEAAAGFAMMAEDGRTGYPGNLDVTHYGLTKAEKITDAPHSEEYEYLGRRFRFKVTSAVNGTFETSLTEVK